MTDSTVVLGPGAVVLRRQLGPASWAVLETLVESAANRDGGLVATASVRDLAPRLGLAHNTVARAVRRLVDVGVVTVVQTRDERGAFGASVYRLSLPSHAIDVASAPIARVDVGRPSRRTSGRPSVAVEQLVLLPV